MDPREGPPGGGRPFPAPPPVAGLLRGDGADRGRVFGDEGGLPARRHPVEPAPEGARAGQEGEKEHETAGPERKAPSPSVVAGLHLAPKRGPEHVTTDGAGA